MTLARHMTDHREAIVERWLAEYLAPFPDQSATFFRTSTDRFANPVGSTAARSLRTLLAHLADTAADAASAAALDALIRMRAVQELPPSRALAFLPALRGIIRDELGESLAPAEAARLDRAVEALLLQAADLYLACREQVFALRSREERARVHSLLRRAELVVDEPRTDGEDGAEPLEGRS